jgi:hypothetical protein
MLGTVVSALWTILSADNFAVPLWIFHEITSVLGSIGSA